jgi:DnaJ-class molecular chaperone
MRGNTVSSAISHSFTILSDEQKRKDYDLYGTDDPNGAAGNHGGGMRFRSNPGEEMSPEDLFNFMFGNVAHMRGGPGFRVYSRSFGTRPAHPGADRGTGWWVQFMQMLPVLLLVASQFLSFGSNTQEVRVRRAY